MKKIKNTEAAHYRTSHSLHTNKKTRGKTPKQGKKKNTVVAYCRTRHSHTLSGVSSKSRTWGHPHFEVLHSSQLTRSVPFVKTLMADVRVSFIAYIHICFFGRKILLNFFFCQDAHGRRPRQLYCLYTYGSAVLHIYASALLPIYIFVFLGGKSC